MKKLFNVFGFNFLLVLSIITAIYLKNDNSTSIILKNESGNEKNKKRLEELEKELLETKDLLDKEYTFNSKLLEENKKLKGMLENYLKIKAELEEFKELLNNEYTSKNELLKYKAEAEEKLKKYDKLLRIIGKEDKYFSHNDSSKITNVINESKNKIDSHSLDKTQKIAISIGSGLTLLAISICGTAIGLNKKSLKK
ncbi:hypothetical protein [Mycoplasma capricolum]|uniref:hypothetical protein n=1 Tax=Mycoplasma capricolum TaxID=2095 RepID=UPI0022F3F1B4|nr:hypothetical protein [Mycoplasma capricolum]WBX36442.1 hypothetical protein NO343_01095 [Mycoplasma capricolum subsp. capricolum]